MFGLNFCTYFKSTPSLPPKQQCQQRPLVSMSRDWRVCPFSFQNLIYRNPNTCLTRDIWKHPPYVLLGIIKPFECAELRQHHFNDSQDNFVWASCKIIILLFASILHPHEHLFRCDEGILWGQKQIKDSKILEANMQRKEKTEQLWRALFGEGEQGNVCIE